MQNSAWEVPLKEKDWRPVWRGGGEVIKPQIYTTRKRGGRRFVVRQPSTYYTVQRFADSLQIGDLLVICDSISNSKARNWKHAKHHLCFQWQFNRIDA